MDPLGFLNNLMAPLGREHCLIYWVFGIMAFIGAVLILVQGLYMMLTGGKGNRRYIGMGLVINSLWVFLTYYLYRIIYSICNKTL